MKPSWCASLPIVTTPIGDQPKPVTLILPYYNNPEFLHAQVNGWQAYPASLRQHLSAIIVDDGSSLPAAPVLESLTHPFPIRLFRIKVDIRWNWLAARNIAFKHAPAGWCLVTDMDHVLPIPSAQSLVYGDHDNFTIYGLSRIEHTGELLEPHKNSWFLRRLMYWSVGGYDERLSGLYGTDGDWRRRCAKTASMAILKDHLIRYQYQGDSSTTTYKRKQPEDARVARLIAARGFGWKPKVLSFPYEEVALRVAVV